MSVRWGEFGVSTLVIAIAAGLALWTMPAWELQDMSAYRGAAERLVSGGPLYAPPGPVLDTAEVYRYAPWFAALWIPLLPIPPEALAVLWGVTLVTASITAVLPLLSELTPLRLAVASLGLILCLRAAAIGNVEPLMVAVLVHGVERRSGPLWIALAASLKAAPIVLALVYLGRGEVRRFAWTFALTTVLVAPMLLFDLTHYPTGPGASISMLALLGPVPWLIGLVIGAAITVGLARGRWAWMAAAVTYLIALPRLGLYNFPMLMVGAPSVLDTRWRRGGTKSGSALVGREAGNQAVGEVD